MEVKSSLLRRLVPLLLLAALVSVLLVLAAGGLGGRADDENLRLVRQSVRRAAVQCYALEGFYPTQLDYLEAHYGVSVDSDRFFVDYQYVASNLMPDIAVLPIS